MQIWVVHASCLNLSLFFSCFHCMCVCVYALYLSLFFSLVVRLPKMTSLRSCSVTTLLFFFLLLRFWSFYVSVSRMRIDFFSFLAFPSSFSEKKSFGVWSIGGFGVYHLLFACRRLQGNAKREKNGGKGERSIAPCNNRKTLPTLNDLIIIGRLKIDLVE